MLNKWIRELGEIKFRDNNELIRKVPSLSLLSSLLSPPIPLFQWYPESKEILLDLKMKC
jgi:hypothetical protein